MNVRYTSPFAPMTETARGRRVLITGSSGFVGHHLADVLDHLGWKVTGVDKASRSDAPPDFHFGPADAPQILNACERSAFDVVVHLAGISNTLETSVDILQRENVDTTINLAQACQRAQIPFVYASSASVYGTALTSAPLREGDEEDRSRTTGPLNLYAASKLSVDRQMRQLTTDVHWYGLRFTNVFGPGEQRKGAMESIASQILRSAAHRQAVRLFDDTLKASRDFVPVQWICDAIVTVIVRRPPSGIYNVGSGVSVTFEQLLRWCASMVQPDDLQLELVPNPIRASYQYSNSVCIDALKSALPASGSIALTEVRIAMEALYREFRKAAVLSRDALPGGTF